MSNVKANDRVRKYEPVIAECKRMRACGMCGRECSSWHPKWREKYPDFCGFAMRAMRSR